MKLPVVFTAGNSSSQPPTTVPSSPPPHLPPERSGLASGALAPPALVAVTLCAQPFGASSSFLQAHPDLEGVLWEELGEAISGMPAWNSFFFEKKGEHTRLGLF